MCLLSRRSGENWLYRFTFATSDQAMIHRIDVHTSFVHRYFLNAHTMQVSLQQQLDIFLTSQEVHGCCNIGNVWCVKIVVMSDQGGFGGVFFSVCPRTMPVLLMKTIDCQNIKKWQCCSDEIPMVAEFLRDKDVYWFMPGKLNTMTSSLFHLVSLRRVSRLQSWA